MATPRAGVPRPVPTATLLAKNIQKLVTLNAELTEIEDAAIYVNGNVIEWVGKTSGAPWLNRNGPDHGRRVLASHFHA